MSLGRGLGVVCSREVLRLLDFSDRERQIYDITAKWNLKKNDTNEVIFKTEIGSQTQKTKGKVGLGCGRGDKLGL